MIERCGECKFYAKHDAESGECYGNPPQVFPMPGRPNLAGEPTVAMHKFRPRMHRDEKTCHLFKPTMLQ